MKAYRVTISADAPASAVPTVWHASLEVVATRFSSALGFAIREWERTAGYGYKGHRVHVQVVRLPDEDLRRVERALERRAELRDAKKMRLVED